MGEQSGQHIGTMLAQACGKEHPGNCLADRTEAIYRVTGVPFLSLQGGHEDCPLTRLLGSNFVRRRMRSRPAVAQNYGATWPAGAGTPPGVKEFRESRKKAPSVCSNQAVDPVQCALLKTQLVASLQPVSTIEGRIRMLNSTIRGLPEELVEDLRETVLMPFLFRMPPRLDSRIGYLAAVCHSWRAFP